MNDIEAKATPENQPFRQIFEENGVRRPLYKPTVGDYLEGRMLIEQRRTNQLLVLQCKLLMHILTWSGGDGTEYATELDRIMGSLHEQ